MGPNSEAPGFHKAALTPREALLFEAGVKLGGVFHQYIGMPVSTTTAEQLARTIESAVRLQPFVTDVVVSIHPDRVPDVGEGRFAYRYLSPEMLSVQVTLQDGPTTVVARLEHRAELKYPLMSVLTVEGVDPEGSAAPRARRRT